MDTKKILPVVGWLAIPVIMFLSPPPEGLTTVAWHLAAFYVAAILGLILRPLPDAAVLFVTLGAYSLYQTGRVVIPAAERINPGTADIVVSASGVNLALSGYVTTTCWLVFAAFLVGRAFIDTNLGSRIAYVLIGKFGKTPLGLGYVAAFTDLAISPSTPSNTARTGGIILPIFRSLSVTLGSEPGPTNRKFGAYICLLLHAISLTTATMWLTSNAVTLLAFNFARQIFEVNISWGTTALGAAPLGFVVLMFAPWFLYQIYKPSVTSIDNKSISQEGLAKLGPMSYREKMLTVLFLGALTLWSTATITKIDATAVVVAFVGSLLFFRVVTWETLVSEKSAWTTLMWYGGIISLSGGLARAEFFVWMADVLRKAVSFEGMGPVTIMLIITLLTLPTRYLFASAAAFVGTMIPVMMTLAKIGDVPPMFATFVIHGSLFYFCLVTHFGNAVSPVLFGAGYVDQKTWWILGLVMAAVFTTIHLSLGIPYWKMIGFW